MQQESDGRNLASADSRANPPTDHESPDELDDWDDDWDDNGGDDEDDDHEGPDLPNDWNPAGWKKNVAELNAALTSNTPVVIIAAATAAEILSRRLSRWITFACPASSAQVIQLLEIHASVCATLRALKTKSAQLLTGKTRDSDATFLKCTALPLRERLHAQRNVEGKLEALASFMHELLSTTIGTTSDGANVCPGPKTVHHWTKLILADDSEPFEQLPLTAAEHAGFAHVLSEFEKNPSCVDSPRDAKSHLSKGPSPLIEAAASITRDAHAKEKKRLKNAKDKAREKEKKAAVKAAAMVPPAETVLSAKPSSSKSISVLTVSCAESTEAGRFLKNTPASLTSTTMGKLSASNTQTTLSAPVTGSALSAKSSNSKSTAVNAATVSCADSSDGGLPSKNTMAPLTTTTHAEHSELLSRLMATNLSLRAQPLTRPSRGV